MALTARKPAEDRRAALDDILEVLARHNPHLSKTALKAAGKAVAALSAATAQLSAAQQRQIAAQEDKLAQAVEAAVEAVAARPALTVLRPAEPPAVSRGAGLEDLLHVDEGRRRLTAYAQPQRLEEWAGPVAGPTELAKRFGISRSTLHDWQRRGAVIGLLKGERKHVFPLAQFVDGRPLQGIAAVTRIIGNPRVAWQWLMEPKPSLGGAPLERLKAGKLDAVAAAAERDFG